MSKRILIVDDVDKVRILLKSIIKMKNYELAGEAVNGEEALQLYKELKPDLVLLDIVMPVVNGIEALKNIIAFDPEAKVIMVTGEDDRDTFKETLKAGALDHIIKPFDPVRILYTLEKTFAEE